MHGVEHGAIIYRRKLGQGGKRMETHLGHTTAPPNEKTRNIFFDDPLFEDFAVRALSLDGCPLGEVSTTASRIEDGEF
jgi:hypothetical protein